jgi:hypothetical protein
VVGRPWSSNVLPLPADVDAYVRAAGNSLKERRCLEHVDWTGNLRFHKWFSAGFSLFSRNLICLLHNQVLFLPSRCDILLPGLNVFSIFDCKTKWF